MYPPPTTKSDFGISGKSSADVELSNLFDLISRDGIVAITEPVAMIAFSKVCSIVCPSAFSIFNVDELIKLALP